MPGINNVYLAIAVVLGLMIWDYRQTIKNSVLYTDLLEKHFGREQFELNPIFQGSIQNRRYHPIHFLGMVLIASLLYFMHWSAVTGWGRTTLGSWYFYQGFILSPFLIIHFRHLSIQAAAKILRSDPTAVTGKVVETYHYSLRMAGAQAVVFFWLFLFLLLINPSSFMAGITFGAFILLLATKVWLRRAQRTRQK